VLYHQSFGYADISKQIPNTPSARFQTASISKPFTATAVLQLLEKGQLQLSDPFVKYFPEFPYPTITLKHLLSHTSGLPGLELYEPLVRQHPQLIITNKTTIPALQNWKRDLYFQPGAQWKYCNTNYVLLALLVEKVSGLPFPLYLKRNIFQPARMRDTYVKTIGNQLNDSKLVTNHLFPTLYTAVPVAAEKAQVQDSVGMWKLRFEQTNVVGTVGDGNVISTAYDLLQFDQALYSGKLISKRTMALAATPTTLNDGTIASCGMEVDYGGNTSYGLGWVLYRDTEVGNIVGHDGYTGGIATMLYRNVTKNQTIIMFDNTVGIQFREKVASVVNILNDKPPLPLAIKKSVARLYGVALLNDGPERALLQFNTMRTDTLRYYISEREINILGYEFLFNGYTTQSLEAFKINTLLFPTSFNVYDSYGDAFRQLGRRTEAMLMYQRALTLNPNSEGSKQSLLQLQASHK
jgi:CubicO group peptidase (beta-lactamase class C family)